MLNPFRKCVPNGWDESVHWFRFIHEEAYYYGRTGKHEPYSHRWKGYMRIAALLLPTLDRFEDGWRLLGPRWITRECGELEWWSLFEVGRMDGDFEFKGPERW